MMNKNYSVKENVLTSSIYSEMHEVCGFRSYEKEDIDYALAHDLFDVVVYDGSKAIAMARLVGDGRIVFFLKDVMVHPDYQKRGCGDLLMRSIFSYLELHACNGAYVGLMSTPNKETFYARYGFVKRPTEGLGSGMVLFYES